MSHKSALENCELSGTDLDVRKGDTEKKGRECVNEISSHGNKFNAQFLFRFFHKIYVRKFNKYILEESGHA